MDEKLSIFRHKNRQHTNTANSKKIRKFNTEHDDNSDELILFNKYTKKNNKLNILNKSIELDLKIKMPKLNLLLTVFITTLVLLNMPTIINATDLQQDEEIVVLKYDDTEYSKFDKSAKYYSSTQYNAKGMGPLYNSTNKVLDSFIGKDAIPADYIIVEENNIKLGPKAEKNEWGDLLKHYWAILLIIAITALLIVLMPIIGLCFCCCRCAGSCGGRSQPFDKKHDTCRRIFLGLLLICVTTGILFGVVVTFATNSYMQEGIDESTRSVRTASVDIQTFMNHTSAEINHILIKNYNELSQNLENVLDKTADVIMDELEIASKAITLQNLTQFVQTFPAIKGNLESMKSITNELRVDASQLSDGLRGVKRELLLSLNKCVAPACKQFMRDYEIGKLDANGFDYNQLPDVSNIINSVQELIETDIASSVNHGNDAIKEIKESFKNAIKGSVPEVKSAVYKAGDAIKNLNNQLGNYMKSFSEELGRNTDLYTNEADKYLDEYSIYRFYVGVAISSVLLLVLCSLTIALLCGICGKRPDGYGDDCCNKGSGSRFLMLAISVIFLTISILAAATLVHFLVGLILHRGVCKPLSDPENDQIFQQIEKYIDLNKLFSNNIQMKNKNLRKFQNTGSLPPFRISNVIIDCRNNHTIYEVMRVQNHIDIEQIKEYPKDFDIEGKIEELKKKIQLNTDDFKMLTPNDIKKIEKLKNSDLKSFDSDKFVDNLEKNITSLNLTEIAEKLRQTAEDIKGTNKMMDVEVSLKNQALHLETYQINLVQPMIENTKQLINLASVLEKNLKLKDKPFEDSINDILKEIKEAEDFMKNSGNTFVKEKAETLANFFTKQITNYLDVVIKAIKNNIGKCGPLWNVYDSAIVLACNKIVDPFNGFWAGLGWCILLFLPTLVISIKLSSLYQKSDPYPGPLVESEYLYDAYSERDNIPLANGPKNKRRKKDRTRGSRDHRGDYYEESSSSHVPVGVGTGGRDTRYNDMAPKHWDGGPPRYTNPPLAPPASEYERPPPYYYPGASEQD